MTVSLATKSELKTAEQILDRFFRDAEGKTNRQIDVYFALQDLDIPREKADPAIQYLVSRGLINTFGPDVAFLTDLGVQVIADDVDISTLDKVLKDFIQKPIADSPPAAQAGAAPGKPAKAKNPRPKVPSLTHIDLEGQEYTLKLEWLCTIGRADGNQVRVNDQRASKMHAELRFEEDKYVLHDLESANGTLLNGNYVVEPETLKHDDEIVIGRTMLLFTAPQKFGAPAAPPPSDDAEGAATIVPIGAPTERPAKSDDPIGVQVSDPSAPVVSPVPIRVVRGRPAPASRPPSAADLFAEPSREPSGADLFNAQAEPATEAPNDLFGGPRSPAPSAPSDNLFGDPRTEAADSDDLFGSESTVASSGPSDLFGEPRTEAVDDIFEPAPVEVGRPQLDAADLEELEPLATLASVPVIEAPSTNEPDWNEDTPRSPDRDLLENQPVSQVTPKEPEREDANTVMVSRDSLFEGDSGADLEDTGEHEAVTEDPPRWGDEPAAMGSHPDFAREAERRAPAAPSAPSVDAEFMPVASESVADLEAPSRHLIQSARNEATETIDAEIPDDTAFHRVLEELRTQTERADLPDRQAVLDAIDLLQRHPYIRVVLQKIGA